MSVEFANDRAEAIYKPGNGNTIRYRRHAGVYFHADTCPEVIQALNNVRISNKRIRIFLGDTKTGKSWLDEHDVEGYVGCSTGSLKIPLLIYNRRSMGGGALLDNCTIKIKTTRGEVLYQHPNFHTGEFSIRETTADETIGEKSLLAMGYSHAVDVDSKNNANFKSLEEAQNT